MSDLVQKFPTLGECNRYTNGMCSTRSCLIRGGWKQGDAVDYDLATCETRDIRKTIEALEAEVAALEAVADTSREKWAALVQREQKRAERLREAITSATANMDHDYAYEVLRKAVTEESSVTQPTTEDCSVVRKADVRAVQLRKALETVSGHITNAIICMATGGTKGRATDILNHASDIACKALEDDKQ